MSASDVRNRHGMAVKAGDRCIVRIGIRKERERVEAEIVRLMGAFVRVRFTDGSEQMVPATALYGVER